jgi:hypothetical protein
MNDKPQRNFRIVVDGIRAVLQYSVDVPQAAATVVGTRVVPQYSVDVAQTAATIVTSRSPIQEALVNFKGAISVVDETAYAANQELAQAA